MKVVGVKMKTQNGKITHSQYVRVNLVDSEHPFFSRVWHGLHVLDATSPLLTHSARKKIRENGDAWPTDWFDDPEKIRKKLNFHSLVGYFVPFRLFDDGCLSFLLFSITRFLQSMVRAIYLLVRCMRTNGIHLG